MHKETILVIDDEPALQRLLKVAIGSHGYEVVAATNGHEGVVMAAQWQPDLILLDLGLPDTDGLAVLKRLREWYVRPILILSVRNDEHNIVGALDSGANDYLTKPFNSSELLARIRANLRQGVQQTPNAAVFRCGPLSVDFVNRRVSLSDTEVKLTVTEYDLLRFFAQHHGKVLTHSQVLKEVWGPNASHQNQYLRVYVNHLRQKIELNSSDPKFIVTELGVGYRFCGGLETT